MANYSYDPNTPLLKLSPSDQWTIGNAFQGTFICGGTGSGKSSGSGRTLAHAFLKAGFGGLVLCAKPDEADVWRRYAAETGRENSLIVMDGSGKKRFNFLDYELARVDAGRHTTPFALETLMKIHEAIKIIDGDGGGGSNESFWRDSVRLLLSHSIDMLYLAYGRITFMELLLFIQTMPTSVKQSREDPEYLARSFHYKTVGIAEQNADTPTQRTNLSIINHWFLSFYDMDHKTRSNIIATLNAMMLDFTKGDLAQIFCTDTNIVPDMSHHGAVILLDFPLKQWQRGGILAQHIFKYAWMRAIERRKAAPDARPCFLWADEYQLFTSSYDAEFQSTARSSKACTVYLTQSVPALRNAVRSTVAKDAVDDLLNNFLTRIIHTCLDSTTQFWAAETIGKSLVWRHSQNESINQGVNWGESTSSNTGWGTGYSSGNADGITTNRQETGGRNSGYNHGRNRSENEGISSGQSGGGSRGESQGFSRQETLDYTVQPSFFGSGLRMGGEANQYLVDGIFLVGGKIWNHNAQPYLLCSFHQNAS